MSIRWEDQAEVIIKPEQKIDQFPNPSNELWRCVLTLARNSGFPWASLDGLDYSTAPEDRTPRRIITRLMNETELGRQISQIEDENEKDIHNNPWTNHWPRELVIKYVSLLDEMKQGIGEFEYITRLGTWEFRPRRSSIYWKVENDGRLYFSYGINPGKAICVELGASNESGEAPCMVKWEFGDSSSIPREKITAAKERVISLFKGLVNETDFKTKLDKILPD